MTAKRTALYDVHERAGAAFTDFAGYDMPVRYSSDLQEHHAVRTAAGLFDLSHMAEIDIQGPDSGAYLDYALSNTLSALEVGQAKYSLLLAEHGGVIDDLIVYRLSADHYWIVANAANRTAAVSALQGRTTHFDVVVSDVSDDWCLIAVQGPNARSIVEKTSSVKPASDLATLRYYRVIEAELGPEHGYIARTGYTGEDGFEIFVRNSYAATLWNELLEAGQAHDIALCGLACRDTLRLEAGMPLYGHELNLDIHPYQAGLARVVDHSKASFVGGDALGAGVDSARRVLVGLQAEGKRAPRADYEVTNTEGDTVIGIVTSGALSPTLGYPIAMAYVDPAFSSPGTQIAVDVRGQSLPVTVTALPFYSRKKDTP